MALNGLINSGRFRAYVEQILVSELREGGIVIINLGTARVLTWELPSSS